MSQGQKRTGLTKVEIYDGDARRPSTNQLTGADSTTSQAFWVGQFVLTTAATAEAITAKHVNPGIKAVVKAKTDNTENVKLGHSTLSAEMTTVSVSLLPGESVAYPVDDFSRIFMYCAFDTTSVELTLV